MTEELKDFPDKETGGLKAKVQKVRLDYFGRDRWIHLWLAEKRTRLVAAVVPPLDRLGLVPDTISYLGITLLVGVALFFVRAPLVAVLFLLGHVVCDGVDGAYARHTKKASQSGAFTDLVCDQLGMMVVALMTILHHLVPPLLGSVYVALYLIVVVFGVLINVLALGTRITITSKYFLYGCFGLWAIWGVNYFSPLMYFFSGIMAVEVVIGYFRLKRGIRKKFDAEVRFTEGDQYSSKLNYALNVAVPVSALLLIVVAANIVPIRAMFDRPSLKITWNPGPLIGDGNRKILGVGAGGKSLYILLEGDTAPELHEVDPVKGTLGKYFVAPPYIDPAFPTFLVDGDLLVIADRSTRLFMGMNLEASFSSKQAVIVLTLPVQHLEITAASTASWKGAHVWLVANYLYTRKTYLVDPNVAMKKGSLLAGKVTSYVNGGFPSGLAVADDVVFAFNKSPFQGLIYAARLTKLVADTDLLEASSARFSPPSPDAIGPVRLGEDLVMVGPERRIFRVPISSIVGKTLSRR